MSYLLDKLLTPERLSEVIAADREAGMAAAVDAIDHAPLCTIGDCERLMAAIVARMVRFDRATRLDFNPFMEALIEAVGELTRIDIPDDRALALEARRDWRATERKEGE